MKRVYEPNKAEAKLREALTQLYLMKHAVGNEKPESINKRIDAIRALLLELQEEVF
tara:strand:- start:3045 stop:3212 length:168 start_codon:yes stop_codon:yes gene_type:complete